MVIKEVLLCWRAPQLHLKPDPTLKYLPPSIGLRVNMCEFEITVRTISKDITGLTRSRKCHSLGAPRLPVCELTVLENLRIV
jgi:hypothetical protein